MSKQKRYNSFVIIPGAPNLESPQTNATASSANSTLSASSDDAELLSLGDGTLRLLINKNGSKVCPQIIFLTDNTESTGQTPHLLRTYMARIASEKQYNLELSIAAHGDDHAIGAFPATSRIPIEIFALKIATILTSTSSLYNNFDIKNKPIHFTFYTCNSAFCDINISMSKDEIEKTIHQDSLIGKFAHAMKKLGFNGITTSGFRGYVCNLKGNKGAVVIQDYLDTKSQAASKTQFTLHPEGYITLPPLPFYHVNFASSSKPIVTEVTSSAKISPGMSSSLSTPSWINRVELERKADTTSQKSLSSKLFP